MRTNATKHVILGGIRGHSRHGVGSPHSGGIQDVDGRQDSGRHCNSGTGLDINILDIAEDIVDPEELSSLGLFLSGGFSAAQEVFLSTVESLFLSSPE